jgi:hypothetical protein
MRCPLKILIGKNPVAVNSLGSLLGELSTRWGGLANLGERAYAACIKVEIDLHVIAALHQESKTEAPLAHVVLEDARDEKGLCFGHFISLGR